MSAAARGARAGAAGGRAGRRRTQMHISVRRRQTSGSHASQRCHGGPTRWATTGACAVAKPAGTETERIIGTQMPHAVPRTKASEAPSAQYDSSGAVTQQLSHAITVTTVSAAPTLMLAAAWKQAHMPVGARPLLTKSAHCRKKSEHVHAPSHPKATSSGASGKEHGEDQQQIPTTNSVACSATRTARPSHAPSVTRPGLAPAPLAEVMSSQSIYRASSRFARGARRRRRHGRHQKFSRGS